MEKPNIYETFGLRLARLRQARGLSQRGLAEALSVTRQAVSNWERGQAVPDLGMLARLCQVLEVDWNRLCGDTEPPRRPRRVGILAALGVLVLLAAVALPLRQAVPQAEETPQYGGLRGEVLRSHQVTAVEVGPNGLQKQAAGELARQLEALEERGSISLTPELRQSFDLAGEACAFRFLPAYENGTFADRDAVLTWLYLGLSQGEAPTVTQVDGWLAAWFSPSAQWEHGSTEHYRLTEEDRYWPESACSGTCRYGLEALERREDGSFLARLRLTETDGTGVKLPVRLLTVELTAKDGQLCFAAVVWGGETLESM